LWHRVGEEKRRGVPPLVFIQAPCDRGLSAAARCLSPMIRRAIA
jgi:hypothetical protein